MKLATLRSDDGTIAVRLEGNTVIEVAGVPDVGSLLALPDWQEIARRADGRTRRVDELQPSDWAPVIPSPSKIVCVGLNYRKHILEMGRDLPEFPTLFAKYAEALIGPNDDIVVPEYASDAVDWEGELAIIVGRKAHRLSTSSAVHAIAGYSVINDITMRDYQYRTPEWFQGKTFESSTPLGPVLVTAEEYGVDTELRTEVDGTVKQRTLTSDLVFGPAELIAYISQIFTLNPGDVIASGTPGGVGHARTPPQYLTDGATLTTVIEGIGTLTNSVRLGV